MKLMFRILSTFQLSPLLSLSLFFYLSSFSLVKRFSALHRIPQTYRTNVQTIRLSEQFPKRRFNVIVISRNSRKRVTFLCTGCLCRFSYFLALFYTILHVHLSETLDFGDRRETRCIRNIAWCVDSRPILATSTDSARRRQSSVKRDRVKRNCCIN